MYNPGYDQENADLGGTPSQNPHVSQPVGPPDYTQPGYPPPSTAYPPQPSGYPPAPVQKQPMDSASNTNTTVVIQQQPTAVIVQGAREWSSGLCNCFDDCGVCMLGLLSWLSNVPVIELEVSALAEECVCAGVFNPVALRTKIRLMHNIQGGIMSDCCTMIFCHPCAFCQMAREIKTHRM